jgi:hypothetical protein
MAENQKILNILNGIEERLSVIMKSKEGYHDLLKTISKFYMLGTVNNLIIHTKMPEATDFKSRKAWEKEYKRKTKLGAKALDLFSIDKSRNIDVNTRDHMLYKAYDVSQTKGKEVDHSKDVPAFTSNEIIAILVDFVDVNIKTSHFDEDDERHSYFNPKTNRIILSDELTEKETLSALLHEITHLEEFEAQPQPLKKFGIFNPIVKRDPKKRFILDSCAAVLCEYFGIENLYNFDELNAVTEGLDKASRLDLVDQVIKRFHKTAKDIDSLGQKIILQRRNGKSDPYLRTFEPDEKEPDEMQDPDRSETLNERLERVRRERMERLNSKPTQTFRPVIKKSRGRGGR